MVKLAEKVPLLTQEIRGGDRNQPFSQGVRKQYIAQGSERKKQDKKGGQKHLVCVSMGAEEEGEDTCHTIGGSQVMYFMTLTLWDH